ncbi:neprilysin-2-like isoform X4 [Vespula squamosa]|uniref:Neprilysin-2-like isoform X4 n=1 Tax=Vespula squamosa TaxID=30214 RepID=A0ABD2BHG0_VESSQ
MTNSMKQTVIKNPTWWKRRSALERGLTVIAVSGVLLCIALAVALGVLAANTASCEQSSNVKLAINIAQRIDVITTRVDRSAQWRKEWVAEIE